MPGGPSMTTVDWAELINKWFPQVTDTRRALARSLREYRCSVSVRGGTSRQRTLA